MANPVLVFIVALQNLSTAKPFSHFTVIPFFTLRNLFSHCETFLHTAKPFATLRNPFSHSEIFTVKKFIGEITRWKNIFSLQNFTVKKGFMTAKFHSEEMIFPVLLLRNFSDQKRFSLWHLNVFHYEISQLQNLFYYEISRNKQSYICFWLLSNIFLTIAFLMQVDDEFLEKLKINNFRICAQYL